MNTEVLAMEIEEILVERKSRVLGTTMSKQQQGC
jgi:hypothetical protein